MSNDFSNEDSRKLEALRNKYTELETEIAKCIIGQKQVIELMFITLLCGGHSILHGVPGLAKTLAVSALAKICSVEFNRIQFTPDLMPSDITGTEIIEDNKAGSRIFKFVKGPVFTNILLADEINRTPPKTQSALLEAMQEYAVTAYGKKYELEYPFFVFATQNPIEQEGTFSLPEAQLDRFLFNIEMDYPDFDEEVKIASKKSYFELDQLKTVLSKSDLKDFQEFIEQIPIAEEIIRYIVKIIKYTRPQNSPVEDVKKYVSYGAGPRASQYVVNASKAKAALEKHYAVNKTDIKKMLYPILNHRIILNYSAYSDDISVKDIIETICSYVENEI